MAHTGVEILPFFLDQCEFTAGEWRGNDDGISTVSLYLNICVKVASNDRGCLILEILYVNVVGVFSAKREDARQRDKSEKGSSSQDTSLVKICLQDITLCCHQAAD